MEAQVTPDEVAFDYLGEVLDAYDLIEDEDRMSFLHVIKFPLDSGQVHLLAIPLRFHFQEVVPSIAKALKETNTEFDAMILVQDAWTYPDYIFEAIGLDRDQLSALFEQVRPSDFPGRINISTALWCPKEGPMVGINRKRGEPESTKRHDESKLVAVAGQVPKALRELVGSNG